MTRTSFGAPWSTTLKVMTALVNLILLGAAVAGVVISVRGGPLPTLVMVALPLLLLGLVSIFAVRGYQLSPGKLVIQRLGWKSVLSLSDLQGAEADSSAMSGSLRAFGIGGVFGFVGHFQNSRLGPYEAFATDPQRSVVLRFSSRTVVITPDDPQAFTAALKALGHS